MDHPLKQLEFVLNVSGFSIDLSSKNKFRIVFHICHNFIMMIFGIYLAILLSVDGLKQLITEEYTYCAPIYLVTITHFVIFLQRKEIRKFVQIFKEIMPINDKVRDNFKNIYKKTWNGVKLCILGQTLMLLLVFIWDIIDELVALVYGYADTTEIPPMPMVRVIGLEKGLTQKWIILLVSTIYVTFWKFSLFAYLVGTNMMLVFSLNELKMFNYQLKTNYNEFLIKNPKIVMRKMIKKHNECLR